MAYEPPHMPTRDEILKKALEIFHEANPQVMAITPEENELKEGSYWERARTELMSGIRSALEQYLSQLESEADKIREELGLEKPLPTSERLTELENELARLEDRYKSTKDRLTEAEEELRKIHEAKPPPIVAPPPPLPTPSPAPMPAGLSDEEVRALWEEFTFILRQAGVPEPTLYRSRFDETLNRKESSMENAARLRRLTERIIAEAKRPAVPAPIPVTAVPIRVTIPGPRTRQLVTEICLVCRRYHTIDVDLMRRVSEGSDEIRGAGRVHHEPPILGFPDRFYHMCPDCRFEQFGYRDIYDALAYLLAEGRRSEYKKVKLTKDKLRAVGLDEADLSEIQAQEARYRVSPS